MTGLAPHPELRPKACNPPTRHCARGEALPANGARLWGQCSAGFPPVPPLAAPRGRAPKRIFDFRGSREARTACPFCGQEEWQGWDQRVALEHVAGNATVDRGTEAFPLTCANCGFIRLQSAHVLDDPRAQALPGD